MKRTLGWLLHPVLLGALALLLLSALVWWVLPLFTWNGEHLFDGVWSRVSLIAALWLAWALVLGLRAWRRKRANARLLQGLAAGAPAADREAQVLAQRFEQAITRLRTQAKPSLWRPGRYLYELPWYLFVGAPGSGKTTALRHAGLQFLPAGGGQDDAIAVRGVGGTRNCDWWFTREAVLIDTAGRYATQDSDAAADAGAWNNFLALLKKSRPRQPINGILLTVSVHDLLQQGPEDRAEHATRLRARLAELQSSLGVRAPVYVLVTKVDLIAGFFETFGEMGKEARDQVWGFSFDLPPPGAADPLQSFDADYQALEARLGEQLPQHLQAERAVPRRAAQFQFLQEFAALRTPLHDFLGQVFSGGSASEQPPLVRGVYFTSGTQEGTPIDRVMGTLGRAFGLARPDALAAGSHGRSFFLHNLLRRVVFAERGLVALDAAAERRRRALRWSAIGAMGLASVALLAGWLVSYSRNAGYSDTVAGRIPSIKAQIEAVPAAPAGDVTLLAQPLAAVRAAAVPAGFAVDDPDLLDTLGLYQGRKLDAGAQLAYQRLLEEAFMPRIARRLEERLRASGRGNLENAYLALKSYLMLYTPDKLDATLLKNWITLDWDAQFAGLAPAQRSALDQHLEALLADGAPHAAVPMDKALVASVREMLAGFPLEHRIYGQLRRQLGVGGPPDFSVARAAGPQAAQVFTRASGEALTRGIPGLYTREGYQRSFQPALPAAAARLAAEESWVLGTPGDPARLLAQAAGGDLADRVRRLYLQDYVKLWEAYLADVRLLRAPDLSRNVELARLLAAVDSPLTAFQRAVAAETTLVPPVQAAASGGVSATAAAAAEKARIAREELARLAGAPPAATSGAGLPNQAIERLVDDRFATYHRLFQGQPAPIEEQAKLFNEVYVQLAAIDAAQKSKSPPPAGGGERLKAAASQQPELVRGVVESLVDTGARSGRAAESAALTSELKPITDFCQRSIANRYPFAAGSQADVLPDDFGQLFGAGGMLDDFYQRRLASLVDTGRATWTYKPLADGSRPASPAALAEFQRAARIKEAFFRSGGKAPGFRLDVRLLELADGLKELTLDIDGQALKFTAGSANVATVTWPSQRVAAQLRVSTQPPTTPLAFDGPWALFRLFDRFETQLSPQPEKFTVLMNLDGKRARLEVTANSVLNPFRMAEIKQFRCPGAL